MKIEEGEVRWGKKSEDVWREYKKRNKNLKKEKKGKEDQYGNKIDEWNRKVWIGKAKKENERKMEEVKERKE